MKINTNARYVMQTILALALTLTLGGQVWATTGGDGPGGGPAGTTGSGDGGAGSSSGAGDGGAGGGSGSGSGSGSVPSVYSGRLVQSGAQHGSAFLTASQEYTSDVFNMCKSSKDVTMRDLKFDGSFSFTSDLNLDMSDTITCMKGMGFSFNGTAVGRPLPLGTK